MASTEDLKDSLQQLRDQLAAGQPLSAEQRKQLDAVLTDVGRRLEGEEQSSEESLAERLREAAEHFEDTHPDLTLAVGTLVRVLNRMGI